MDGNIETGLNRFARNDVSTKRRFVLCVSGSVESQDLGELFVAKDGIPHVLTNWADVNTYTRTGFGDQVFVTPSFATAPSAAELVLLETYGVEVIPLARKTSTGEYITSRATAGLPASTQAALFTVTGKIKVHAIIGEVTTVIQTQACNTKIVANPTVGADVDLCATANITADDVGSQLSITGTFATALVETASGALVFQAAPSIVAAGSIDLSTDATNTGSVKWVLIWSPISPGALVIAA